MPDLLIAPSAPPGLYMTSAHAYDTHEPWIRGEPELEMHVISRYGPAKDRAGTVLCSAATASDPLRRYDQNDYNWNGAVMILNDAEVRKYNYIDGTPDGERFLLQMWEDDYASCQIFTSGQILDRALVWLGFGAPGVWAGLHCVPKDPTVLDNFYCGAGLYTATWYLSRSLWTIVQDASGAEDDLVGTVITNSDASARGITPDVGTTHTLLDEYGHKAGGITLVRHELGQALYAR